MRYAVSPKPVLGPCPCRNCGEPLYWARRNTRVLNVTTGLLWWRDWTGRIHKCLARARAKGYNQSAGSGGESNTLTHGASLKATTRTAGVAASIEVVAR